MKRQIPTGVFALAVILATLAVLCIVGKIQTGPEEPGSQIARANISAPDFEGKTSTGKTFRLSEQRGKVVLINFWATWCGPCRSEIPDLIALQKKYGPKGFTVIGLADDKDLPTAATFASKMGMNYAVMIIPENVKPLYGGVEGLPTSFLIDRNGKVVFAMEGIRPDLPVEETWSKQIEKVL